MGDAKIEAEGDNTPARIPSAGVAVPPVTGARGAHVLPNIRRQMIAILRSRGVAACDTEDLTQGALLVVLQRWHDLQDRFDSGLLAYALCVVHTTQIHSYRQRSRNVQLDEDDTFAEDATPLDDLLAESDLRTRRLAALAELSSDAKAVLMARVVRGLSVKVTAAELGIPEGTVKSRYRLAAEEWAALCKRRGL